MNQLRRTLRREEENLLDSNRLRTDNDIFQREFRMILNVEALKG